MEEIIERFREFIESPAGARYIARRVRVGAKAMVAEQLRLDAWLKDRAVFSGNPTERGERKC